MHGTRVHQSTHEHLIQSEGVCEWHNPDRSLHTVLGTRFSNKCMWRCRFVEDQSSLCPRETVAAMRSSELGFRSRKPVSIIFNLAKWSSVILEKVRDCRE